MTVALGKISFSDTPDVNGINVLTVGTGLAQGSLTGTAGEIVIDTTNPAAPIIGIPDNPIFGGTGGLVLPTGTTAQRPAAPTLGTLRYNSTTNVSEQYANNVWVPIGRAVQSITGNITSTTSTAFKTTNSVPLITEGTAIWSQVLTPNVIGSTVLCQFAVTLAHSVYGRMAFAAVFAGNTCIGMSTSWITNTGTTVTIPMQCAYTTTSLAAVTFSARVGTLGVTGTTSLAAYNTAWTIAAVGGGTLYVNQNAAGTYGAALQTEFRLSETLP